MSNAEIFPDQLHIEQIRKRLWCDREFGKAAVMVGAGFSQNAERISTSTPRFPLWRELAEHIYDSLYPPETPLEQDRKTKKLAAISGGGALKLASEYEVTFGQQALDDFIKESIPDSNYLPGRLHELLLSLPWSDVFTTNYDTLLERTRPAIYDRKYDRVLTVSDIPNQMKPRIVKLHGSFPSHRPFITTEEHYRTYPNKFAPFVNMVQQSIMENAFCLIGFSGDDPNFLHWSGWVRDNFGSNNPPIYLCGLLNRSPSQRRVLESRKVIPINLSPLFPESHWPDPEIRYAKAVEWFLLNLVYGKPPEIINWPTPSSGSIWTPSEDLPPIPPGPQPLSDPGELSHDPSLLQTEDIEKLGGTWRQKRLEYPGWVVAPKNNRDELWMDTERWIEPVLRSIEKLTPPKNLFLLYELNWRLKTALIPLFMNWLKKITPIIETFNPYPRLVEIEDAAIRSDNDEYKRWDWQLIGECWVELVFALAREAREDQDEKRFHLWMDRLEKVVKQRTEWQTRWFYEKCLFYLFRFDQEKIRETLENWPTTHDLPFWEVRRASILAELGELNEAEKIAEESLTGIRSRLQPYSMDYSLLSQEGWAMVLLNAIKGNKRDDKEDFVGQYRDRWEKLGTYRCNPFPEIDRLELVLNGPHPSPKPEKETKKAFDPRRMTVTRHMRSDGRISVFLPAFAFLRIFEEGAVPMKCGRYNMFSDAVVNSAKWIESFAPLWSLSSMIRTGKDKELEEWFDRVRIATLTQDEVDHLNHIFINSLTQAIRHLTGNPEQIGLAGTSFSQRQVTIISEMLSRLCFRFSIGQLDQLFKLTLDMYKLPIFRQQYILQGCVDNLFERILYAMPQSEILQRILELLSLPIPTEMGFEVSDHQRWSDPFNHIKWLEDTKLDPDFDRSTWVGPIANLVRVVKDGTDEARERAAVRLERLYEIDGLTSEENEAFGKALWSKINRNTDLPSAIRFYDSAFLNLPETEAGIAKENFRKYLLSKDFPRVVQRSISIGSPENRYIREWLSGTIPLFAQNEEEQKFVDWTTDEVTQLLKKADGWWNDEKEDLQDEFINKHSSIADTVRAHFSGLVELMAGVILPRLADADEETKTLAGRLLSEMEQSGFCVLSALPMTLFIDPNSYDEIVRKLRVGLNSMKEVEVRGSAFGIFRWLVHGSRHGIPAPPDDLLNELVNRVFTRRQPGLDSAIGQLSVIVWRLPDLLNESQMGSLCVALEYLIKETELPKRQDRETISGLCITIPINDRPEYRKLAAELAYRLFILFTSRNKEVPPILIKWKEICQNDPLPEVRKVWR
ncbi:SIR2-like domain-containing protein [Candidatus Methanophagaceae archaeon]|nr:SIR2-like domain-containing protein [Methanophagales archaeon]